MQGLGGIAARIAAIHQQIHALNPPSPQTARTGETGRTGQTGQTGQAAAAGAQAVRGNDFAAQLASAMGQAAPARPAALQLNKDGVPVDLAKYGNGKIPSEALHSIGRGGHRMWAPAGQQFTAMAEAAKRDGVTIGVTDSYRSYDQQVDLAKRKGLYSQGGLAAKPGTSEHGWGLSLDLDLDSKAQAWMRKHAGDYGFKENVPREPWHWTFKPG